MYKVLIIGDLHGNINRLNELIDKINPQEILAVGDLSIYLNDSNKNQHKHGHITLEKVAPFKIPLRSILGNHDDYHLIVEDHGEKLKKLNIFYLPQAKVIKIRNTTILPLGGIESPVMRYRSKTQFQTHQYKFFSNNEIIEALLNNKPYSIDLVITHQAPCFVLPDNLPSGRDEGTLAFNSILDYIQPKYYIHGHHHVSYVTTYGTDSGYTIAIGLGNLKRNPKAYTILDADSAIISDNLE